MDDAPLDMPSSGLQNKNAQDDEAMLALGKVQQVKRHFGFWTLLGLTASMMCTWEAIFFANATAMLNGGPPTLIYGFIVAVIGSLATAASLAEMASIYPTSGGQYHWTAMLAPPSQKTFWSWLNGWIATLGWIGNTAAGAYFTATIIPGVAGQIDPTYIYKRWHGTLLMWAVLLVCFVINSAGTRLLSMLEGVILFFHIACFLAVLVPMLYFSPKASATEVFATFTNSAGWSSNGVAWLVGFALSANLPLVGYDGPAHLAEETRNASWNVPWCMTMTVVVNGILGLGVCIAFSFCIVPTITDALESPTGYDFIEVFYSAMGASGTAGLTALLIFLVWCATIAFLATSSRQLWAFARDNGLPFSGYFSHINKTLAVPLRALALCATVPCLIGLINIGSTAAFNAIVSFTEAGIFISYLIPICLLIIKKVKREEINYGPWKMPFTLGLAVNVFSAAYLTITVIFGFFPPAVPVAPVSMNWSIVVFGGLVIIGLVWYGLYGRKHYSGPVIERPVIAVTETIGKGE